MLLSSLIPIIRFLRRVFFVPTIKPLTSPIAIVKRAQQTLPPTLPISIALDQTTDQLTKPPSSNSDDINNSESEPESVAPTSRTGRKAIAKSGGMIPADEAEKVLGAPVGLPVGDKPKDGSLRINIKLDLYVEIELKATIKGDITLSLL